MPTPLMTQNLQRFHDSKRKISEELLKEHRFSAKDHRGAVPIVSVEHPEIMDHQPGVIFLANYDVAARSIAKRTHRVATDDESREFLAKQEEHKKEAEERMAEKAEVSGVSQARRGSRNSQEKDNK